ncbi:hypothetical protein ACGRHY_27910 [Streptomyces sp. HK10]|uniref:hypothetical protein n=1 Tax=Streptomyces sp. HK10 TaxID=3373255 RepID=UPI0037497839
MLHNPSIRCAQCHGADLVGVLTHRSDGSTDVSTLTCTFCGLCWEASDTPACDGPSYEQAYPSSSVPDLTDEELALLLLAEDIKERSTAALAGRGPAVDSSEHRDFLLRKAAYLDRAAHKVELGWFCRRYTTESADDAGAKAAHAADELLRFDSRHQGAYTLGPISADSRSWGGVGEARAYVRQEYLAWRLAEEAETDQVEFRPHRGGTGELFDAGGRPL